MKLTSGNFNGEQFYEVDDVKVTKEEYQAKMKELESKLYPHLKQKSINDITPKEWDRMGERWAKQDWQDPVEKEFPHKILRASDKQVETAPDLRGICMEEKVKALDYMIGGNHYRKFKIQPAEFCYINDIPYLEATAIKYLCRWKDKGGIQDLEKAKHFIDLLIEFQNGKQ